MNRSRYPLPLLALAILAAGPALADATPSYDANITEREVLAAQQAWGEALVRIGRAHAEDGPEQARRVAAEVIDQAYGYGLGPVLFKPTLAEPPQAFRTTRAGALAYFVGGDPEFPKDGGFALKGWQAFEIRNAAIHINGDVATTMGNVILTAADGSRTTVDKTWSFKKTDDGQLRIVLHHSSLPYAAP